MRTLPFLLSLLIVVAAAAQDAEKIVSAPEAGFRLTIPEDLGWNHREDRGKEGLKAVHIGPSEAGGAIVLSIQVSFVDDRSAEALDQHLVELRTAVEAIESVTDMEDYETEIADRTAWGLDLHQVSAGVTYRVHLMFLRDRGIQYRIQFHAPRDQFKEEWGLARQVLAGFELIEIDSKAKDRLRLRDLASKCGSQIDWVGSWAEASTRARDDGRLIVVSVFSQGGFELGNAFDEEVFMDPDVIALMNSRFVGWRWSQGQPAPFVSHDVFGLSGSTFGAGLLVVTPDGPVVRQIFFPHTQLAADTLRDALREHSELAPPPPPPTSGRAERVAFLIDTGQLETARRTLSEKSTDPESAALAYQRARFHRMKRDGNAALEALRAADKARASERDHPLTSALLLIDEARIHIGMGHYDHAGKLLERGLESDPDDAERAQAMFLLGRLAWANGDEDRTREHWSALARDFPDQPVAWAAAAGLAGPLLKIDRHPNLTWPSESLMRMSAIPDPAPSVPTLDIATSLSDAIDWLINAQRPDGGWNLPFGERDTHPAPNGIVMASQAICTRALIRAASEWDELSPAKAGRCREVALLGLRRYLADRETLRQHPRPVAFMDYTCWGSAYGLFCLSTVLDPEYGMMNVLSESERVAVKEEAALLVQDLVRVQAENGGWSYYISGSVDGTSSGTAMSFTTATVLNALHAARQQGIKVPDRVYDRGSACLASTRGTNGVFEYMRRGAGPHQAGEVPPAGAAARGPLCALALRNAGLLDADAMKPTFQTFIEYLGGFGAEARKALMHAGPGGQGSHYLLYDYSTAAEALRRTDPSALDAATRQLVRAAILREMARCRNADGSFVDNPILGTAPGTGMAVLALLDLAQDYAAEEPGPDEAVQSVRRRPPGLRRLIRDPGIRESPFSQIILGVCVVEEEQELTIPVGRNTLVAHFRKEWGQ